MSSHECPEARYPCGTHETILETCLLNYSAFKESKSKMCTLQPARSSHQPGITRRATPGSQPRPSGTARAHTASIYIRSHKIDTPDTAAMDNAQMRSQSEMAQSAGTSAIAMSLFTKHGMDMRLQASRPLCCWTESTMGASAFSIWAIAFAR